MKFHLSFDIKKPARLINHNQGIFLIGSCFTENIGEKLRKYKYFIHENPHGVLFNPVSVADAITDCIENVRVNETNLFHYQEGFHSWRHHSRYSALTPENAVTRINTSISNAHTFLKTAGQVIITLGSAWVYSLTDKAANGQQGMIVANNHKAPADWFRRKLLSPEDVMNVLDNLVHRLFLFNPSLQIIFTISPVRHIRDGVVENNRSKAVLIQAVHQLVDKFDKLYYFPSYELVIDDLRDYRFYSEDMVHPNYHATQYVWEKLVGACMDEKTRLLMEEIHSINLAFQHKPFNPASEQHRKFLKTFLEKTKMLQSQNQHLDFQNEIDFFNKALG